MSEIKLIREYRDRLITDVVTGQMDVRGWKPTPDDIVSDDDLASLDVNDADTPEEEAADDSD
jgi:type I restriction enzyme S subunit